MIQIILMILIFTAKPNESFITDKSSVRGFGIPSPISCPMFNQLRKGTLLTTSLKRVPRVIPVKKKSAKTKVFFHFILSMPPMMLVGATFGRPLGIGRSQG